MANKGMIDGQVDASSRLEAGREDRTHPINKRVHPGKTQRSDFQTKGVEVPSKVQRTRVDPDEANDLRRTPLIDVTPIVSPSGHSHIFEPPPSKL